MDNSNTQPVILTHLIESTHTLLKEVKQDLREVENPSTKSSVRSEEDFLLKTRCSNNSKVSALGQKLLDLNLILDILNYQHESKSETYSPELTFQFFQKDLFCVDIETLGKLKILPDWDHKNYPDDKKKLLLLRSAIVKQRLMDERHKEEFEDEGDSTEEDEEDSTGEEEKDSTGEEEEDSREENEEDEVSWENLSSSSQNEDMYDCIRKDQESLQEENDLIHLNESFMERQFKFYGTISPQGDVTFPSFDLEHRDNEEFDTLKCLVRELPLKNAFCSEIIKAVKDTENILFDFQSFKTISRNATQLKRFQTVYQMIYVLLEKNKFNPFDLLDPKKGTILKNLFSFMAKGPKQWDSEAGTNLLVVEQLIRYHDQLIRDHNLPLGDKFYDTLRIRLILNKIIIDLTEVSNSHDLLRLTNSFSIYQMAKKLDIDYTLWFLNIPSYGEFNKLSSNGGLLQTFLTFAEEMFWILSRKNYEQIREYCKDSRKFHLKKQVNQDIYTYKDQPFSIRVKTGDDRCFTIGLLLEHPYDKFNKLKRDVLYKKENELVKLTLFTNKLTSFDHRTEVAVVMVVPGTKPDDKSIKKRWVQNTVNTLALQAAHFRNKP